MPRAFVLLSLSLSLLLLAGISGAEEMLLWPLPDPEPPGLSDTGYTVSPGEVVIGKIKMPEYDFWATDDYYGGGIGIKSQRESLSVYTVVIRDWFYYAPALKIYENGKEVDRITFDSEDVYGETFQVYVAHLRDGTVKIAYRYGKMTDWQILYSKVAESDRYSVTALKAFDFEKQVLDPQGGGVDESEPYPTPTTEDEKYKEKYTLALAGLGGMALAVLAVLLTRKR